MTRNADTNDISTKTVRRRRRQPVEAMKCRPAQDPQLKEDEWKILQV